MEERNINKVIYNTSGDVNEIGDFLGAGNDEVITSFDRLKNKEIRIWTDQGFYDRTLTPGDVLKYDNGDSETIRSRYNVEEN